MKSLRNEKPWVLKRQDYNGNVYDIASFTSKEAAEHEQHVYEDRGHKQMYFVEKSKVAP